MNRADLVQAVVERSGLKKADAERAVGATLEAIEDALGRGDKVGLAGFGTFEVREREARWGRNPRTGEAIEISATRVPAFRAGKSLRDAVHR